MQTLGWGFPAELREVMALNEQVSEDKLVEGRFREHELADTVQNVPGIGAVLGAEFLAAVGSDQEEFASLDALTAFPCGAPASRDSCHGLGSTPASPERFHVEASQVRSASAWRRVARSLENSSSVFVSTSVYGRPCRLV
ncbi:hypothetical protein [Streptomyces sp. NPDC012510]|uniref:hypothetical protein n=1 Tax=Streptomyces sp. NPDC012510 TaxID=3364838 RepID=UPI0036E98F1D